MTSTAIRTPLGPHLGDGVHGVPPALLRRTMGHFATGVTVVTAIDHDGSAFGTTANSVTSVSLDPPLLLVCLRHESETLAAIRDAGRFGVNMLRADQRHLSDGFARPSDAITWRGVRHRVREGVVVLDDALATLECTLHDTLDGGDHAIVVGRVTAADHADDGHEPLLFYRGAYTALEHGAAPRPEPDGPTVALPSVLGDLRMTSLSPDDDGGVSVAVSVGEPRGVPGALLYLHRGCLLGDALGSAVCAGRARLRGALTRMGTGGPGVVVYHRSADGIATCCGADGAGGPPPTADEIAAVRRAARALELREVRLIGGPQEARALAEAGLRVSALIPSHDPRRTDVP